MICCGEPQIGELEREYVRRVLESGNLTEGDWVDRFAQCLAGAVRRPAVPVSSGTAALHVALLAVGVQPGDEVIVPATTYVATANAAIMCGATVRVADVDRNTWTIDPLCVARLLTCKTAAVVPVHLYGVPANVEAIEDVLLDAYCRTGRRVAIVEDCAEAFGASTPLGPVGSLGDAAAFSFYGSKTITTGGEGGAVCWKSIEVGARAEHVSHQSMTVRRYAHDCVGFNYRMTEIQAAFGVAQMERMQRFLDARRQVFAWYDQRLGPCDWVRRQAIPGGYRHGFWAYAVRTRRYAATVAKEMLDAGVETRPVFPPLWETPQVGRSDFVDGSIAGEISRYGLVLPTHCGLAENDVDVVCRELKKACA